MLKKEEIVPGTKLRINEQIRPVPAQQAHLDEYFTHIPMTATFDSMMEQVAPPAHDILSVFNFLTGYCKLYPGDIVEVTDTVKRKDGILCVAVRDYQGTEGTVDWVNIKVNAAII